MAGALALGHSLISFALIWGAVAAVCHASRQPPPHSSDGAAARCPSTGITFLAAEGHSLTLPGLLPQAAIYQAYKERFSLPLGL